MLILDFKTDLPSLFQPLRRYVYLINCENENSEIFSQLNSDFEEFQEGITNKNNYEVYANIIFLYP